MQFAEGQRVHAFSGGVLREGHYEADILWEGWVETHCMMRLKDGTRFICRKSIVRLTRELPELVHSGA